MASGPYLFFVLGHRIVADLAKRFRFPTENHLVKSDSSPKWSIQQLRFSYLSATDIELFPASRNNLDVRTDNHLMRSGYLALQRSRGVGRITRWGLVRTHPADAAR